MHDDWLRSNLVYPQSSMLGNTILNQLNAVGYITSTCKPIVEVEYKLFRKSKYMKIV